MIEPMGGMRASPNEVLKSMITIYVGYLQRHAGMIGPDVTPALLALQSSVRRLRDETQLKLH